MNHHRFHHGCTTIPSNTSEKSQIIVVGGSRNSQDIEVLDVSSSAWIKVAKIPFRTPSGNTVTFSKSPAYKIYIIGGTASLGSMGSSHYTKAIFGLTYSNVLKLVGNLTEGRSFHTSLNVDPSDIPGCS